MRRLGWGAAAVPPLQARPAHPPPRPPARSQARPAPRRQPPPPRCEGASTPNKLNAPCLHSVLALDACLPVSACHPAELWPHPPPASLQMYRHAHLSSAQWGGERRRRRSQPHTSPPLPPSCASTHAHPALHVLSLVGWVPRRASTQRMPPMWGALGPRLGPPLSHRVAGAAARHAGAAAAPRCALTVRAGGGAGSGVGDVVVVVGGGEGGVGGVCVCARWRWCWR